MHLEGNVVIQKLSKLSTINDVKFLCWKKNMDSAASLDEGSSSDAASHPYFEVRTKRHQKQRQEMRNESEGGRSHDGIGNCTPTAGFSEAAHRSMQAAFGTQLQEMVLRALLQSTTSLVGSSSGVLHHAGEAAIDFPNYSSGKPTVASTWNDNAYHKAEARRRKRPDMMRTSAGEESNSQEDFPVPKNCTAEQRALRTRRLNRSRAKKANDLTSNRKAVKKLPYVIHVDGMSKPKGIHRHKWKAAVRGQCGRLDPSMDNINHHPKQVVDSIWHALEKEWEFEGHAHKAREMFEKSATKFMRNRKMQLKYKCLKSVDGWKPDDVTESHWQKIVQLTKKSMTKQAMGTSNESGGKGKAINSADTIHTDVSICERKGHEDQSSTRTAELMALPSEIVASEEDVVDAEILKLQRQLLKLQSTKKCKEPLRHDVMEVPILETTDKGHMSDMHEAMDLWKENVPPRVDSRHKKSTFMTLSSEKLKDSGKERHDGSGGSKNSPFTQGGASGSKMVLEELPDANAIQPIECGDVVKMIALINDEQEDVGQGIFMGSASSKLSRKVVPKGWCTIKVSSFKPTAGSQPCPFPSGWKDHIKHKTLRDAEGRLILWPEHMLLS